MSCADELQTLIGLANDACQAAFNNEKCREDAVNWGDLGCIEAQFCADEHGNTWYHVLIEEAFPSADNLRNFVMEYLAAAEYAGVEVETAW